MSLASRAAALRSSNLVQWFTFFIQCVSPASSKRGILLNKICKTEFLSVVFHVDRVRFVIVLSCPSRPSQVATFVSFVIVDPIYFKFVFECFVNVTDGSHVVDECDGVLELFTKTDSSGAVVDVLSVRRLVAPATDREPFTSYPLVDFIRRPSPCFLYNLFP